MEVSDLFEVANYCIIEVLVGPFCLWKFVFREVGPVCSGLASHTAAEVFELRLSFEVETID